MAEEDAQKRLLIQDPDSKGGGGYSPSSAAREEEITMAMGIESEGPMTAALLPKFDSSPSPSPSPSSARQGRGANLACTFCLAVVGAVLVGTALAFVIEPGYERRGGSESSGFSPQEVRNWGKARALKKLERPILFVISSDGFRWGYNHKVATPNIDRLRLNGTEAETGMIPVYPSFTFPNHYSIATGLYPAWHGIIANHFSNPEADGEPFYQGNLNPEWWLGEPIWETVTKNGFQAATYFWPGSEVQKDPWTCPPQFCMAYNSSVPYEERVDTVLGYLDLPVEQRPVYSSLYFESPDEEGHEVGPDAPQISEAVARVDAMIGRLISGLEKRGVFEDTTIVLVGDHGMVGNCDSKVVYVEDFKPWIEVDPDWVDGTGAIFSLRPPPEVNVKSVFAKIQAALASGKVRNGEFLQLYLREDLPGRFLYSYSDRVQPIVGIPAEGFKVVYSRSKASQCGGSHGYDNTLLSMRTIFIAHGPQFARGRKVPSFINVELYNVFTSILGLNIVAATNGSAVFASSLLLPSS